MFLSFLSNTGSRTGPSRRCHMASMKQVPCLLPLSDRVYMTKIHWARGEYGQLSIICTPYPWIYGVGIYKNSNVLITPPQDPSLIPNSTVMTFYLSFCSSACHFFSFIRNFPNPLWTPQWPLKNVKLKAVVDLVEKQLKQEHIKTSFSECNSPVFVIQHISGK